MRGGLRASVVMLLGAAALAGGCTVGSGAGSASGPIFVVGCREGADFGTAVAPGMPLQPACFDLTPTFFTGDPVEDIGEGIHANRLIIHEQRTGNRIEINDTITFDVVNTFEVARCLRGEILPDGTPNWDTRPVAGADGQPILVPGPNGQPTTVPWCDRSGVAGTPEPLTCSAAVRTPAVAPVARINLGPLEYLRVHVVPLFTCPGRRTATSAEGARRSATAVGGWIDFLDFGSYFVAAPYTLSPDFKVDFGDRLQANFHLVLLDDRVIYALEQPIAVPIPPTQMGGVLDGYFDFTLERGRAAQPFP